MALDRRRCQGGWGRSERCWHVRDQFCGLSAEIAVYAENEAEARARAAGQLRLRGLKVAERYQPTASSRRSRRRGGWSSATSETFQNTLICSRNDARPQSGSDMRIERIWQTVWICMCMCGSCRRFELITGYDGDSPLSRSAGVALVGSVSANSW